MKLSYLHSMRAAFNKEHKQLLKQQDVYRPELDGYPGPARSGVQDTPLEPRHRKFFNAPAPGTIGKVGYPDQAWSDVRSFRPR